jgi:hypothetical protein
MAQQGLKHFRQPILLIGSKNETKDAVIGMTPSWMPESLVDGDKSRLGKRIEDFGNPIIQNQFIGPKVVKNLARDPSLDGQLDELSIKLIVQNEQAHDFDWLASWIVLLSYPQALEFARRISRASFRAMQPQPIEWLLPLLLSLSKASFPERTLSSFPGPAEPALLPRGPAFLEMSACQSKCSDRSPDVFLLL